MKDSYSFDLDEAGLQASYDAHRAAYISLFERLGLPYVIVSAMSGAMGGSASEEFLAPMDVGEDTYIRCTSCDYAANVEAVVTPAPPAIAFDGLPAAVVHDTPDTPTIATLVDFVNADPALRQPDRDWTAADTLKNVVVKLRHPDGTDRAARDRPAWRPRGRHETPRSTGRARRARTVRRGRLREAPVTGQGLHRPRRARDGQRVGHPLPRRPAHRRRHRVDHRRRLARQPRASTWWPGATSPPTARSRRPRSATATCARRAAPTVEIARGIEIGHIFQLGRKYAEALGLKVQDENGKPVVPTMGSYGVGVTRALAAIAEANHDDIGLVWPREIAPADVHVVIAGKADGPQIPAGEQLAAELEAAGLRVLLDDRYGPSPGVKFKDAELIGVPTIVIVGRGIADETNPTIEVKDRRSGDRVDVALADVVAHLVATCRP